MINKPYLLFLGDATDQLAAKTAAGIAHWCRADCVGQMRLPGCNADLRLPDLTVAEAVAQGARTLIVGVANRGGHFSPSWIRELHRALEAGMDIASGLHSRLSDIPGLADLAVRRGRRLFDIRHPTGEFEVGNGKKREECIAANEAAARLTNPDAACIGISINTAKLTEAAARQLLLETEDRTGLPCVDAARIGVGPLVAPIVG